MGLGSIFGISTLLLSLLTSTNSIARVRVSASPILDAVETSSRTIQKRAPVPYPYGDPFPGEFQYENWDPNDSGQKARAEKIHKAFGEWRDMASAAVTEASDSNSASLARWAGTQLQSDFIDLFGAMWNADTNSPGDAIAGMICDQTNFDPSEAGPNTLAYTQPGSGRFHVTPNGESKKLNSDVQQSDLDDFASANMRTLPMTLLHEMTHVRAINDAINEQVIDTASGSYKCFMLADDAKTLNAQNYAWFAGEAYWSRQLNKEFTDPTPQTSLKRATPATTTERTVGEDEAPQASFDDKDSSSEVIPACYGGGSSPFTQGDGADAIDTFCANDEFNDFAIVPKVSFGDGKTSSGMLKALDLKDFSKVGNGNTTLWMDIAFAESDCIGTAAFNKTDCSLQLKKILNGCDTAGDYPKHGGWIAPSSGCLVYRLIPQGAEGPDPMYVQGNDGEMGDWICQDDSTIPDTCICYYQWQSTITDTFDKPNSSGGCADIKEGTPPKND